MRKHLSPIRKDAEIFQIGKDWLLWDFASQSGHWFSGKREAMRFLKINEEDTMQTVNKSYRILTPEHEAAGLYLAEEDHFLCLMRDGQVVARFHSPSVDLGEIIKEADKEVAK